MPLRFVFALHNHQPVGNFDGVFEQAYRDAYWPFLDLLEHYPEIPVALHTSGPLMEWLVERKPEYLDRLRRLVERGQVEILGGPFYEPILPMIPPRDRVGQIRTYRAYLEKLFPTKVRGMWVPERVWEQNLVSDIVDAGMEYTVLDDYHFRQAGLEENQLFGYYLSEDDGKLLRIFPGSERIRYLVPFENDVGKSIAYFGEVATEDPDAVVVFADDGEKFGAWPHTHKHCYQDGWMWRFMDALRNNRHWIQLSTFSQVLDGTPPAGKIYLPDSSYREMTEWALPVPKLLAYNQLLRGLEHDPRGPEVKRFLRGGYWRNFRVKYAEADEMYARMLLVSHRYDQLRAGKDVEAGPLAEARQALYRAQCNCPWWHGAFGGLYLPHLRNAVYHHLIAADNALAQASPPGADYAEAKVADMNLDAAEDVCLKNSRLSAFFNPERGGSLYELDVRTIRHNVLATLCRRPEAYHQVILQRVQSGRNQSVQDGLTFKQAGLEKLLQYDAYLRKSLIDHFYEPRLTLAELHASQEQELGDFATGAYRRRVRQVGKGVQLTLERSGNVAGAAVRLTKEITLQPNADQLAIRYVLENLPRDRPLHFAVEFNFAGMAAGADDRYFYLDGGRRAGQLQTLQDLTNADRLGLVDEWLGLDASLSLSRRGGIWAFPIQTVSQSEGGYELVYQSTAVLPHWSIEPDSQGRWDVEMTLLLDVSRAEKR